MGYGFKLFELYATDGPRNTSRIDLGDGFHHKSSGWTWSREFGNVLASRTAVLTGRPNANRPDEWTEPTPIRSSPQLRVTHVARGKHAQHVFLKIRYGFYGEFDSAMGSSPNDDVDLADKCPSDGYRALLIFPASGHLGRLAVETINQRCPVDVLLAWLNRAAYERANGDAYSRLRAKPLFDLRKLRHMAKNAEQFEAVFTRTDPRSPDGRSDDMILRQKIGTVVRREKVLDEVGDWFRGVGGADGSVGDYVGRLEGIMGLDPAVLNQGGLHFDDAKVVVKHQGETKTFNPATLNKVFVYQVSKDLQVSDTDWRQRVYNELTGVLSEGTDIQL